MNAAFNIAAAWLLPASKEYRAHQKQETILIGEKELMKQGRLLQNPYQPALVMADLVRCENLLAVLE